jgi:hypothetical protein
MSYKYRKDAKVDSNQPKIVQELRDLGFSVETNHDDILCGKFGITGWYEIKNPEYAESKKTGKVLESAKKDSQKKLDKEWKGHRKTIFTTEEIVNDFNRMINDN